MNFMSASKNQTSLSKKKKQFLNTKMISFQKKKKNPIWQFRLNQLFTGNLEPNLNGKSQQSENGEVCYFPREIGKCPRVYVQDSY